MLFNKLHVFKGLVANKTTIICFLSLQGIGNKTNKKQLSLQLEVSVWIFQQWDLQSIWKISFRHSFVLMAWPQLDQYLWCRTQCVLLKASAHKFHTRNDWEVGARWESQQQWAPDCLCLKSGRTHRVSVQNLSVVYSTWALLVASVSPPLATGTVQRKLFAWKWEWQHIL